MEPTPPRPFEGTDWAALIRSHGPLVWRTAYRLLSNEADAADCFQRTFLGAVKLAATAPVQHWPAILVRLATARALEALRARHRDRGRTTALTEDPPGAAADPLETAAAEELADGLRAALATIDPRQAEVFCLVCLEGLTNHEAAVQLGVTANHAGVLLHRARLALQERLHRFAPNREFQS
jgi:RNA polymerase sigma-70 factor (ECF subfamily)